MDKTVIIRPKTISYGYYEFVPRVKIYTPSAPKHRGKWITNTNINDIGGLEQLPISGDKLVITKSYKDRRCLTNYGINTIWLQNEGIIRNRLKIKSTIRNQ